MRSYALVTATLLVAFLGVGRALANYGRINKYLVAQVKNDEVIPNMEAASDWLKKESSKTFYILSGVPDLELKKFTSLQQVVAREAKCDKIDHAILAANERTVGLNNLVLNGAVFRRVDKVMHKIFVDHAKKCNQVYPSRYSAEKARLDRVVAKCVSNIANVILERGEISGMKIYYNPEYLFREYVARKFSIENYNGKDYMKYAIIYNANHDPEIKYLQKIPDELTGKLELHADKVTQLTKRYLIEPCSLFVAQLGPDVFTPASLDAKFYHTDATEADRDFYLGWLSFVICQEVVARKEVVLADVISSANNLVDELKFVHTKAW